MNNLRMDWAPETRALDAWSCAVCGAHRFGPLHRLCKLLQATRNKLHSVAGSSASAADPIRVVELPAGTTRAALAELTTAAVQSALQERGLLDPAQPSPSLAPRRTLRHQPRTRRRQSDRRERVC